MRMPILKNGLFLKGTIAGHGIYIVPKNVRVNFSIVPMKVPEALRIPFEDCKNVSLHSEGKARKRKKNSNRQ
jgi:hypothetical protein